jgi:site-specific DNA recombinase
MRAAVYLRQSMDRTGEELAIDRQREDVVRYVTAMGWEVLGEFVDNDVSATSGKRRPDFERMMALVDEGEVDVILVRHLDRLLRRLIELEDVLMRCDPHGTRIVSTGEGIDTGTDGGRTTARILCSVAQGEVERKSTRQRSAAEQAAEKGRWLGGRRAFGYDKDGVTVRESEAALIRQAYSDLLAGESCGAIARRWNALGVHTTQKKRGGSDEYNTWDHHNVRDVLTNPRNAGKRRYRPGPATIRAAKSKRGLVNADRASIRQNPLLGIVGDAEWPALVSEEVWRAAVDLLTDPSRWRPVKGSKRLLTGVATCSICKEYVHGGAAAHGKPGYRCRSGAHVSRLSAPIDQYIELLAVERLRKPVAIEVFALPVDRESVAPLIAELEGVRKRLAAAPIEFADDDSITAHDLRAMMTRLRERQADLEQRVARSGRADIIGPLVTSRDVKATWQAMSTARKRTVVELLFEQITIHPIGRGNRGFDPASVRVRWREHVAPDDE